MAWEIDEGGGEDGKGEADRISSEDSFHIDSHSMGASTKSSSGPGWVWILGDRDTRY